MVEGGKKVRSEVYSRGDMASIVDAVEMSAKAPLEILPRDVREGRKLQIFVEGMRDGFNAVRQGFDLPKKG